MVGTEVEQNLGERLVAQGLVSAEQLAFARGERRKRGQGKALGAVLVELGYLSEAAVTEVLASMFNLPVMTAADIAPTEEVLSLIPEKTIRRHKVFPVFTVEKELTVAVTDPSDFHLLDLLGVNTHLSIQPVVIGASDLAELIERYFAAGRKGEGGRGWEMRTHDGDAYGAADTGSLERAGRELPVIEIVDKILVQAVREGASDIHVEPTDECLRVRFRIDGVLYDQLELAKNLLSGVISRFKILSELDISEKYIPQDGRIEASIQEREIDLRVSTLPTYYGEKVVLRLLDRTRSIKPLDEIGFSPRNLELFRRLIAEPHGVLLVTGPTGSGKTTTLYSALASVDARTNNVITVEDPVEYQLPRINQVPINRKRGLTFAASLRAMLRQDPDIILVGEIRDPETGNIAAEAALTGHLVFSTLHTNDAPSSINRLIEIGVEPYLIAPSLRGIVAQRLVRTICPACREAYTPSPEERRSLHLESLPGDVTFYRGKGCEACSFRGFKGRTAIHEVLVVDEETRELIAGKASTAELRAHNAAAGFQDMRYDGLRKMAAGLTTGGEVLRATRDVQ